MTQIESYQVNWSWGGHTELWLKTMCSGTILNFPCGKSKLGIRVDASREHKPDVIASVYYPPFKKGAVDWVISDPPFSFYGKGKKWFWKSLADIAIQGIILSTPLRNIKGIKGRRSIFVMTDSPNYMRMFQVFKFNRLTNYQDTFIQTEINFETP